MRAVEMATGTSVADAVESGLGGLGSQVQGWGLRAESGDAGTWRRWCAVLELSWGLLTDFRTHSTAGICVMSMPCSGGPFAGFGASTRA